ncbi:SRPBCC family protein [Leucobacter sp. GX24907]
MSAEASRIVIAERSIAADAASIFDLIADPAQQPRWDGNNNLAEAAPGQRVHAVGDVFLMTITTNDFVRENHVVEFEEGRRIAWRPSEVGEPQPGHLWRWELDPRDDGSTLVRHTFDWSELRDERRIERARKNTAEALRASIDRLAALVETE